MIFFLCLTASAAALVYIFNLPRTVATGGDKTRSAFLEERKEVVYENLRDLNFDYKAGKLPETDYEAMKNTLEDEAAAILAELTRPESRTQTVAASEGKKP